MNISTSWLREWANPDVSDVVLAESLTMAGLEVDGISVVAPAFEKIVVGHVVACEKHPDADQLNVCQINIGAAENLQIICGAKNIRANLKVIVATLGAQLPGGLKIKKAKLRGVESFGMICSESELGMADSSNGISELANDAIIGQNIRKYLDLDDNIIKLDITPNRGDCFSVLGVAREVCANYNLSLKLPKYAVQSTFDKTIKTSVSDANVCPKYLTRLIKGIDNSIATPEWIARKLIRSGQQLHSAVVDITNFVLLELGQPMHAFDASKINGNITVRMAKADEEITLLSEQTVKLNNNTLIIADNIGPLAIAGVMGGLDSITQVNSTDILLESAFFEPVTIAGIARFYGLHTESSLRFERGVDFNITRLAIERATQLIVEICTPQQNAIEVGTINECIDEASLPVLTPITITRAKIQKILGFELEADWIEQKFISLDFQITSKDADSWTIVSPSFRFDIRVPADLVEELARLYGYDKLPVKKLALTANIHSISPAKVPQHEIMRSLVNRGYQEVITYSFIAEQYHNLISPNTKQIKLSNPISAELSIMRSSLWAGLLQSVESNQRRGHTNARFFELGLCFDGVEAQQQSQKIAGIISGNRFSEQWSSTTQALDFYDVKADVECLLLLGATSGNQATFSAAEHPALQIGQSAKIVLNGTHIGWLGALSPVVQKRLSLSKCYLFEMDLTSLQQTSITQYQAFSKYQKTTRDIALVVDEAIEANDLIKSIKDLEQAYLVGINLFDVYVGENVKSGKKSLALNLDYQSAVETLSDEQVNNQISEILTLMQTKYAAVQRV